MAAELNAVLFDAAAQDGVVGRPHVLRHLSEDQLYWAVRTGKLSQVLPSVFAAPGAPDTWRRKLRAIDLWAGRGYALSHRTAAALHGFSRVREGALEVTVTRNLALPHPFVVHRVERLLPSEVTSLGGLKVTSASRTLVDLAKASTEVDIRACMDEALRRKWLTLEQIKAAVGRATKRHGVTCLGKLVREHEGGDGPTESELEARVLEAIAGAGLPPPVKQRAVLARGRLRRLDFHFSGTNVVIEADGYAFHSGIDAFEADRERLNALTLRGFRVLHWTWAALHQRPHELLAQLDRALAQGATR